MGETPHVTAAGAYSVAIGGDNLGSVTIQLFQGEFSLLRTAYRHPGELRAEVPLTEFTGRGWMAERVDEFVGSHPSGYLIIEADAGVGKTMFATWLAVERSWPSHLSRLAGGRQRRTALRSLAAQLIAAWRFESRAPGGVLPLDAGEPDWFAGLLHELAAHRDEVRPGVAIVLVIDGFDEIAHEPDEMPLDLPAVLPPGVFVVGTVRSGTRIPALRKPFEVVQVRSDGPDNDRDLREYLAKASEHEIISRSLTASGISVTAFVDTLAERCGGIWIYAWFVLADLRRDGDVRQIADLPDDLAGYFARNLARLRADESRWDSLYLPVLSTLAALAEPVTLTQLAEFVGINETGALLRFLGSTFRSFLAVEDDRYSVYHASLREFLAGAGTQPDEVLRAELTRAAGTAHDRIVDFYLTRWGGLGEGLPALDPTAAIDGYPLRHLAHHLVAAQREQDLHTLLACEADGQNLWFTVHDTHDLIDHYLDDIDRARTLAERMVDHDHAAGGPAPALGLEVRYALIEASIAGDANQIPPNLLGALVRHGVWPACRALIYATRATDTASRLSLMVAVNEAAPETVPVELMLATARQLAHPDERAAALNSILLFTDEAQRSVIITEYFATRARVGTPLLHDRVKTWHLKFLPSDQRQAAARAAMAQARAADRRDHLAETLAAVAPYLQPDEWPGLLDEILDITDPSSHSYEIAALGRAVLAAWLDEPRRSMVAGHAAAIAHALQDEGLRETFGDLVAKITDPPDDAPDWPDAWPIGQVVANREAIAQRMAATSEPERRRLAGDYLMRAAATLTELTDRATAQVVLLPYLDEPTRDSVSAQLVDLVFAQEEPEIPGTVLAAALPYRPEAEREQLAERFLRRLPERPAHIVNRIAMLPFVSGERLDAVIRDALKAGDVSRHAAHRVRCLQSVARATTGETREDCRAWAAATLGAISDPGELVAALIAQAELSEPEEAEKLRVSALQVCQVPWTRSIGELCQGLPALADLLPDTDAKPAITCLLRSARTLSDAWRYAALSSLVPLLDQPDRAGVVREMLDWIAKTDELSRVNDVLAKALPSYPTEQQRQLALAAVRRAEGSPAFPRLAATLASYLAESDRDRALRTALQLTRGQNDTASASAALIALGDKCMAADAAIRPAALGFVRRHPYRSLRSPNPEIIAMPTGVARDGNGPDSDHVVTYTSPLAPPRAVIVDRGEPFSAAMWDQLVRGEQISVWRRGEEFIRSVSTMPDPEVPQALARARALEYPTLRAQALAVIAAHTGQDALLDEVLEITLNDQINRGCAVPTIAGLLSEAQASAVVTELARQPAPAIRPRAFCNRAPAFEDWEHPDNMAAALEAPNHAFRALAIGAVLPRLPEAERATAGELALSVIRQTTPRLRGFVIAQLWPQMTDEARTSVLANEWRNDGRGPLVIARLALSTQYCWHGPTDSVDFFAFRPGIAQLDRDQTLAVLELGATAIHGLGGPQAVEESAKAILDVQRWWP